MIFTACYTLAFVFFLTNRFQFSAVARHFSLFLIAVFAWSVKDSLSLIFMNYMDADAFARSMNWLSALILIIPLAAFNMIISIHDTNVPPDKRFKYHRPVQYGIIAVIVAIFIGNLIDTNFFYRNITLHPYGYRYSTGIGMAIFNLVLLCSIVIPSVRLLLLSWRKPLSEAFLFSSGALFSTIVVVGSNTIPELAGAFDLPRFGCLSISVFCFMAFVGITFFGKTFSLRQLVEERGKIEMISKSLQELINVTNEDTVYQHICQYAQSIAESRYAGILLFADDRQSYTVKAAGRSDAEFCEQVLNQLPLETTKTYPLERNANFADQIAAPYIRSYTSLLEFFGDYGDTGRLLAVHQRCHIRQIVTYPIMFENTVRGVFVLFFSEPVDNENLFNIFAIQCSLLHKFMLQITELEEKRRMELQVNQSQKMEAIGQLAGGIAHDFNNMLAGISGYSQLIKKRCVANNPQLEQYVDAIIAGSKRAADLTSQLLAYARKGKFQMVTVDVHKAIYDLMQLLFHTIDRRIKITLHLQALSFAITGDPTQIQNALLNLALNARDAMPEGGEITITTQNQLLREETVRTHQNKKYTILPGSYLVISVSDSGLGMDADTRAKLFQPFFTTKDVGKGTGLGLASVYGCVKSHAGYIEVDSEVNKGATFHIYLPLTDECPTDQTDDAIVTVPAKGQGTIMVVDDEDIIRTVCKEALLENGYRVVTCSNGAEAVDYFRTHATEVDLVVLDLIMPIMGGYDCLRHLKDIRQDIRVVISTGYNLNEDTQQIVLRGINGFLKKPFDSDALLKMVAEVLQNPSTAVQGGMDMS